ncbi:MAG TPA: hypothetical protein VLF90_01440 [Patescibacteria group bacterium]|nr:hypothetical protein [Patescibacteria group bacterium]
MEYENLFPDKGPYKNRDITHAFFGLDEEDNQATFLANLEAMQQDDPSVEFVTLGFGRDVIVNAYLSPEQLGELSGGCYVERIGSYQPKGGLTVREEYL